MRRKGLTAVAVSLAMLASAGTAIGGASYPSRVSIGYSPAGGGQFAGNVQSRKVCTAGRAVVLFRKRAGADASIARATTSSRGDWKLRTGKPRRGDYYAQVLPRSSGKAHCGGSRSATTHVS